MNFIEITFPMIVDNTIVYETIRLDKWGKCEPGTPPETETAYKYARRNRGPTVCDWGDWLLNWCRDAVKRKHDPLKVGNRPDDRNWNVDNEINNLDDTTFIEAEMERCGPDSLMVGLDE